MRTRFPRIANRTTSRTLSIAAVLLGGLLFAGAVEAHPKHHKHKHKHHGKHQHHDVERRITRNYDPGPVWVERTRRHAVRRVRPVAIPEVIHYREAASYRTYHDGRLFHRDHGHYHDVYVFPVYRDGYYVATPFEYCSGRRVPTRYVSFDGPRLSFGFRF